MELVSSNDLYMAWSTKASGLARFTGSKIHRCPSRSETINTTKHCLKSFQTDLMCAMKNVCYRHCTPAAQAGAVLGHEERNKIQSIHCIPYKWITSFEYIMSSISNMFMRFLFYIAVVINKTRVRIDINYCVNHPCHEHELLHLQPS